MVAVRCRERELAETDPAHRQSLADALLTLFVLVDRIGDEEVGYAALEKRR